MTSPINLKMLAQKAGVSPATASLALRNDPRIKMSTRERVVFLSKKLNYVPNHLGRALQSSKSYLIGYLLANVTASFFDDILQGINEVALDEGYGILTGITNGSDEKEIKCLDFFRAKRVDGILFSNFTAKTISMLLSFQKQGVPAIACSPYVKKNIGFPYVGTDNIKGGFMAAQYLIKLGHERIDYCFSSYPENDDERYEGLVKATLKYGKEKPVFCPDEKYLIKLLSGKNRPTGLFCYSDFEAIKVKHAIMSLGLKVPQDVSIIGFDDEWFADMPEFKFTTIAQPKKEIGKLSAGLLISRIKGEKVKSKLVLPQLVVRESTSKTTSK